MKAAFPRPVLNGAARLHGRSQTIGGAVTFDRHSYVADHAINLVPAFFHLIGVV